MNARRRFLTLVASIPVLLAGTGAGGYFGAVKLSKAADLGFTIPNPASFYSKAYSGPLASVSGETVGGILGGSTGLVLAGTAIVAVRSARARARYRRPLREYGGFAR
jgi:uncharacterized BrkB/YihY/UPF0761 family membrane protein